MRWFCLGLLMFMGMAGFRATRRLIRDSNDNYYDDDDDVDNTGNGQALTVNGYGEASQ